jgi:hypothetical protein
MADLKRLGQSFEQLAGSHLTLTKPGAGQARPAAHSQKQAGRGGEQRGRVVLA